MGKEFGDAIQGQGSFKQIDRVQKVFLSFQDSYFPFPDHYTSPV